MPRQRFALHKRPGQCDQVPPEPDVQRLPCAGLQVILSLISGSAPVKECNRLNSEQSYDFVCHGCSGDHDLLVPHLGTQACVRSLNFSIVDDWRAWHLGGQSAGWVSFSALFYLSLLENRLWAPAEKDQRHRFLNRCPATATIGLYLRHRVFQLVP